MASNLHDNHISINTTREIDHLWNWLDTLTNKTLVRKLLNERIDNNFYMDKDACLTSIKELNKKLVDKNNLYDIKFIEKENINNTLISEIINSAKQAKELFQKARESSILVQPLLYLYGTEALERCLILMTFQKNNDSQSHGLALSSSKSGCTIRQKGFFQLVHFCVSTDQSIFYKDWYKMNLKDLFYLNPELIYVYEYIYDSPHQQIKEWNKQSQNKQLTIDLEFDRHLPIHKNSINFEYIDILHITCFILSTYMRYAPGSWIAFLENSNEGHLAKIFLTIYPRRMPNLILNYIYGKKFLIAPTARFGGEIKSKFLKKS